MLLALSFSIELGVLIYNLFGIRQKLTVKFTELDRPKYLVDEMVRNAFQSIQHEYDFGNLPR